MKVNFSLAAILGVAASAVFVLPAQAGVLVTSTNAGGSVGDPGAAYGIDGLEVNGTTYNVRFNFGTFNALYASSSASAYAGAPLGPNLGIKILEALSGQFNGIPSGPSIPKLVGANVTGYGTNILTNFYIPEFNTGPNLGQSTFLSCVVGATACADPSNYFPDSNQLATDPILFAQFIPVASSATAVPTPALLPGLMGLGLAALRKKKQAAAVSA
jgi:hypothetical protein